jgi:hypothetical protein
LASGYNESGHGLTFISWSAGCLLVIVMTIATGRTVPRYISTPLSTASAAVHLPLSHLFCI